MRGKLRQHKAALVIMVAMFLLAVIAVPALADPFSISDVSAGNITATSATITWTTDEPGNSTVSYGPTTSPGFTASDSAFVTNHTVNLGELTPGTLYYYGVSSTSELGNITLVDNNEGAYYTFHTSPAISDVQATDIKIGSATITWTTDVPATSVVNYGDTIELGLTAADSNPVTSHSIALSGLSQHTTYYYEVRSADGEGNTATDNNGGEYYTFTTQDFMTELTKPIGYLLLKGLTGTSITLDLFVNSAGEEPLTEKGTELVDLVLKLITGIAKVVGRILAFAH